MKGFRRAIGIVALCFFVAGCATSGPITWDPGTPPESREATATDLGIVPGKVVTVTMADGHGLTGEILTLDEVNLTIQKTTEPAQGAERILPWDEIYSIETGGSGGGGSDDLIILGIVIVVGAVVIIANYMSQMDDMFSSQ